MNTDQIKSILNEVIEEQHPVEETLNDLSNLEQHVAKPSWSTDRAVSLFNTIYGSLKHHQKQQFTNLRKDLVAQHETESEELTQIREHIQETVEEEVLSEISRTPAIQRGVAKQHQSTRDTLAKRLLQAADTVREEIKLAECDFESLSDAVDENDKETVRAELESFAAHLRVKGWHSDDLDKLPSRMEKKDDELDFLEKVESRDKVQFRFQVFLPMLQVNMKQDLSEYTVFPAGNLTFDDLENSDIVRERHSDYVDIEGITDLLDSTTSITFTVSAFEQREAKAAAKDTVATFLDTCSVIHQTAYLEDPQFEDKFEYIVWRSDNQSLPLLSWSRETHRKADLETEQLDILNEYLNADTNDSLLAKRFMRAKHFHRKGNISDRNLDSVINYIACLETISSQEYSNTTEIIENSFVLGRIPASNQDRAKELFETLYHIRNTALHSGRVSNIDKSKLNGVKSILTTMINEMKEAIENGSSDFSEYYSYVNHEIDQNFDDLSSQIESNGLRFNEEYSFTGEVFQEDGTCSGFVEGDVTFFQDGRYVRATCKLDVIEFADVTRSSDDILQLVAEIDGVEVEFDKMAGYQLLSTDVEELTFGGFEISSSD